MTTPPRLRHATVGDLAQVAAADLRPGDDVDAVHVDLGTSAVVDLSRVRLSTCRLARGQLESLDLSAARLHDTRVDDVRAATVDLTDATAHDLVVARGRWGAVLCGGSRWRVATVHGLRVDLWSLRGADLEDVLVEDVVADELDLSMARMRRVALVGCTIGRVVVHHAEAHDVDLSRSRVGEVDGVAGLRGVAVSTTQLVDLALPMAEHLGIVVADGA